MKSYLKDIISKSFEAFGIVPGEISIEHPVDFSHGDYATNAALVYAGRVDKNPRELAEALARKIKSKKDAYIEKVEVAGPGFINLYLSREFFLENIKIILDKGDAYGKHELSSEEKILIEYTDPNPFKEFHIGHLMSNAIGESLSRIIEFSGAEVKRANYQGDVGLHVAKALWGLKDFGGKEVYIKDLGEAYARGAHAYDMDEKAKEEILAINKKVYEKNDADLTRRYDEGRKVSLAYFETIYMRLGTRFDYYFFESETGALGEEIVRKNIGTIFEESEGAIVFRGEHYGMHTRVFVTKEGLPTYEAKELGLAEMKYRIYPYDTSIVLTGNEVREYFQVVLKALELVNFKLAKKTAHISHGMLRLPSGKMSSRTGNVIAAESFLDELAKKILPRVKENKEIDHREQEALAEEISVAAIKYSILRQTAGNDVLFDFEKSLSFEGDSGPYLQYTHARARSIIRKAEVEGVSPKEAMRQNQKEAFSGTRLERLLHRFPEIVEYAGKRHEPHHIAAYLIELARSFNNFYAKESILASGERAPYRIALTAATAVVIKNGLYLLGIKAPERM